jgi:hypothetical protein
MYICSVEPEKNAKQHDCVDTQTTGKASFRVHRSHLLKWVWSNGKKISTGWRVFLSDQGQRGFY